MLSTLNKIQLQVGQNTTLLKYLIQKQRIAAECDHDFDFPLTTEQEMELKACSQNYGFIRKNGKTNANMLVLQL